MVTPEFLAQCGLFVQRGFLSADECRTLLESASGATHEKATVSREGQEGYDEHARSTHQILMPAEAVEPLHEKLQALSARLQTHFAVSVAGCRSPIFLHYGVGDFFSVHADASDHPGTSERIKARKVSAVLFLNEMTDGGPETFSGGELTFYDVFPDNPALKDRGFSLRPEPGLLVAFSAHMRHEVQPITRGTRYSVVTWFS